MSSAAWRQCCAAPRSKGYASPALSAVIHAGSSGGCAQASPSGSASTAQASQCSPGACWPSSVGSTARWPSRFVFGYAQHAAVALAQQVAQAAPAGRVARKRHALGGLLDTRANERIIAGAVEREAALGAPERPVGAQAMNAHVPGRAGDQPGLDLYTGMGRQRAPEAALREAVAQAAPERQRRAVGGKPVDNHQNTITLPSELGSKTETNCSTPERRNSCESLTENCSLFSPHAARRCYTFSEHNFVLSFSYRSTFKRGTCMCAVAMRPHDA
jgi:hypothetical protein